VGEQVEAEYLQTAMNATRLAIRLRARRENEVDRLVLLLLLAELDQRWKDLSGRHPDLLSPEEIRVLLPTLSMQPFAKTEWLDWMRKLATRIGRTLGLGNMSARAMPPGIAMQRRIKAVL
jgi:hypothetical protein